MGKVYLAVTVEVQLFQPRGAGPSYFPKDRPCLRAEEDVGPSAQTTAQGLPPPPPPPA